MIVVMAKQIPPAVRGRMKLWFVELKPNVFISGVKDANAKAVIDYLFEFCPFSSELVVVEEVNKPPYYKIRQKGSPITGLKSLNGMDLIFNKTSEG